MKLSSAEIMVDYRDKLKALRLAEKTLAPTAPNKINCATWSDGNDINFGALIGILNLKSVLRAAVSSEIAEFRRSIEAHGVDIDE